MSQPRKILLSGVKPTGRPHIGNYFGAMKQFVDLLNTGEYECYFMIADYHALNSIQNREEMRSNILELALDYLAIGLDPKKAVLFKQSDVSAHTELAWIFDSLTTMPYLMLAHAFKDRVDQVYFENNDINKVLKEDLYNSDNQKADTFREMINRVFKGINVGTFNYPMLMAADILLYDADVVPVGQDQKQHIEYARDTAQKFNKIFGDTFKLPKELIVDNSKIITGSDGRKMSKSKNNHLPLFASDEEIKKFVMSIVTNSTSKIPENVFAIHHQLYRATKGQQEYTDGLANLYKAKEGKYKELKEALIKDLQDFIRPLRERRNQLAMNKSEIMKVLEEGGKKAQKAAGKKLAEVKSKIGVNLA